MSASFVESADVIRDVRALSETLEPTPDFTTFLGDAAVRGAEEVEARLRADRGYARLPNGDFYRDDRGDIKKENRQVSPEQAQVVLAEAKFVSAIRERSKQSGDFSNFVRDIPAGFAGGREELEARLSADRGYARRSNGDIYRDDRGDIIRESRRVRPEQATGLLDYFDLRTESTVNDQRLTNLASFYGNVNVTRGVLSDEELQARLNASRGYARRPNGDIYRDDRSDVVRETRTVSPADARTLVADAALVREVETAAAQASDTQSYFTSILQGTITSEVELQARLENDGRYARLPNGSFYRDRRGDLIKETREVSTEQRTQLLQLFNQLGECGDYRRQLTDEILRGGDGGQTIRDIESAYAQSMVMSDAELLAARCDTVEQIARAWRRIVADTKITTAIVSTRGDVDEVFRLIRDDPEDDLVDRQRAERLTSLCYDRRRVAFTAGIANALSRPDADIEDLLGRIEDLNASPVLADKERALELTRSVYQAEVLRDQVVLADTLVTNAADPDRYDALLGNIKLRPGVDGYNYDEAVRNRTQRFERLRAVTLEVGVDREVEYAYECFDNSPASVLSLIADIANKNRDQETAEALLEYYKLFLTNRRDIRPDDYQEVFSAEVEAVRKALGLEYKFDQELGTNLPAAKKLAERFSSVILPLFQSLRGEPAYQDLVQSFISGTELGDREPRDRFTINLDQLAAQRGLTETETAYLKSVQALSAFNPYLVAIANANPGLAFAYLESHFTEQSAATYNKYFGDNQRIPYVPLLQVGTGPNGLASLGEIMRTRPDLIGQTLVVDDLDLPSGPFGVPKGDAWDLNSANSSGFDGFRMPDAAPDGLEGKRVRDYGSPTRWFPGERNDGRDTRPGSINTTVDYLPTPDVVSTGRYPNNEDLSLVLQLQTAMLADNLMFKTKLIGVEDAPAGSPGKFLAYMMTYDPAGNPDFRAMYTDGVITSSGLGEKSYGFSLEGSRAQDVLDTQPSTGFPKLSTTLDAFKALASKENQPPIPGETIVIEGSGNSADTLVEYFGGLFESGNPAVRNIRKIYVVGNGKLSKRPRYAQISDLRARNGRESLVELVEARVGDVAYTDPGSPEQSKLRLFNSDGNIITDTQGREIQADHVIAATGFRPQLARIFANTSDAVVSTPAGDRLDTKPVVLPTNPNVAVAETVDSKKELLLVGTASNAAFNVTDKLLQLPRLSREALLRNGAENAVAIGFRAPDTQAAVRLYLENNAGLGRQAQPAEPAKPKRVLIDTARVTNDKTTIDLGNLTPTAGLPPLRRDVTSGSETLTPLLFRNLAPVKLVNGGKDQAYRLNLSVNGTSKLSTVGAVPGDLVSLLSEGVADPYFQAYARNAVRMRRGANNVDIVLRFKNGRLSFKDSYAQAV